MEIKSYFKVSLKWRDWKPSIKEVSYQWADWETYTWLQFEGYASTKDMDRTNDVVVPGAFQKSINQYMENPIIFLQHNSALPIGSVIEASIDDNGLFIVGIVKSDKENIFQDLRTGVIKTMSFWYRVNKYEQQEKKENSKTIYYNEIQELELFEISLVSVPMNPKAKIKSKEELLGKNLTDEEYAKYFQINKDEEYTLFKSISDVMWKFIKKKEEEIDTEEVTTEEVQEVVEELEVKTFDDLKKKSFVKNISGQIEWVKTLDIDCNVKKLDIPDLYKDKIPLWAIYFEWVVSDETVNRYWEKVKNSAFVWQINKFLKNGIILNWHNSDEPIGIPLRVKIEDNQVKVGWYVFDEYTENRVSKGLYRWLSIWFIPTEWVWEDKETWEELSHKDFLKKLNEAETFEEWFAILDKYMFVITKLDWLEYSFVTTPANKWTTIKLDYIDWQKEYIDRYKLLPIEKKDDETPIETVDETPKIDEEVIDPTIEPTEEEKMQIEPVVEVEPTKKPKEEIVEEDKPEEVEQPKEEEVETPKEETPEEEKETIETPEIPENNDWDIVDEPKEEVATPENEVETPANDPLEEKVDEIEKSFTKSIDEINNRYKNVEWLDTLVKEIKSSMETSIKELKAEQSQFQKDVSQVIEWCVDIVNTLAKNFKNFCIDWGLQYTEAKETVKEKKEKELLETPLAKTLSQLKS